MMVTNGFIAFNLCTKKGRAVNRSERHHKFLLHLSTSMMEYTHGGVIHDDIPLKHELSNGQTSRQCVVCSKLGIRRRTRFECLLCERSFCAVCFSKAKVHGGNFSISIKQRRRRYYYYYNYYCYVYILMMMQMMMMMMMMMIMKMMPTNDDDDDNNTDF
jgi:hypothetical protein